jgi:hypothetical protein
MTIDVDAIRAMVAATSDRYEVRDDMLTITFLPEATDSPEWWGRDYAACITLPPGDAAYFAEGRATMLALCDALDAEREKVRVLREALAAVVDIHDYLAAVTGSGFIPIMLGINAKERVAAARAALAATEDGGGA